MGTHLKSRQSGKQRRRHKPKRLRFSSSSPTPNKNCCSSHATRSMIDIHPYRRISGDYRPRVLWCGRRQQGAHLNGLEGQSRAADLECPDICASVQSVARTSTKSPTAVHPSTSGRHSAARQPVAPAEGRRLCGAETPRARPGSEFVLCQTTSFRGLCSVYLQQLPAGHLLKEVVDLLRSLSRGRIG